jgi:hypothetical protein
MKHRQHRIILSMATSAFAFASPAQAQTAREIVPPPNAAIKAQSNAVTLRSGSFSAMMKSLPVKRQVAFPSLRSNPVMALGRGKADFRPMLNNPNALFNVAQKLRAMPQLASVRADDTQVVEVAQGLIVRNYLVYQLKPGVCSNTARRAQLPKATPCVTRTDAQGRAAAFANPQDVHYVADPAARAKAIAAVNAHAATVEAQLDGDITTLRAKFANAAQRAELVAALGEAETARLQALPDDALKTETANSGETAIEQVLFVPSVDKADVASVRTPTPKITAPLMVKQKLDPVMFLTGFTLGRDYEWSQRVQTTIKWCWVGCKRTYFAEVHAGFGYGFGLRFPVRLDGQYKNDGKAATVTANFVPVNGSAADYAAAGLPADQVSNGQELVAKFKAHAGFSAHIPVYPDPPSVDIPFGKDFTDGLPAPFTGGQFPPPAPGEKGLPAAEIPFPDVDLIGGAANFGVVGAKVFPAVKVGLHSDALTFTLRDTLAIPNVKTSITSGQTVTVSVDPKDQSSRFSIGDPVYKLGFNVTPGLTARLWIDISVWSHHWDWPVWFPQLTVTLPPGGQDFTCHQDTSCSRNYTVSAAGVSSTAGATAGENSAYASAVREWGEGYDAKWLPQCLDEKCKFAIRLVRTNTVLAAEKKYSADKSVTIAAAQPLFDKAEGQAATLIQESKDRKSNTGITKKASSGWVLIYKAVWTPRCSDDLCRTNINTLADEMGQALIQRQAQDPNESSLSIQAMIGKEYAPKFQKEIDDSKRRVAGTREGGTGIRG